MTPDDDSSFNPSACADALMQQWRAGTQIPELPVSIRPRILAEGYAAQDRFLAAACGRSARWKLGVGSPAQLRSTGLARPLIGRMAAERIHSNGAHIALPDTGAATIECEIAFVLASDLPPDARPGPLDEWIRELHVSF